MGAISRMFAPQAAISSDDIRRALQEAGLSGYSSYGTSASGQTVSPATALGVSAVFACVKVISETAGQLPLILYRRTSKGKERAVNHPLYRLIGAKPNGFNNSLAFREMLTAHTCLRGNAFAFITRVGGGRVYELLPIPSDCVGINRDSNTWEVTYTVSQTAGRSGTFTSKEIFHLMGMTLDGYTGVSPLTYARETIGLSLALKQHGARTFRNGARPSGAVTVEQVLKDDAYKRMKNNLDEGYSGENVHKTMLLEGGAKFTPISMTSDDAQFIETFNLQTPEIARYYRMPLHKIQDLSRSTNNNIEQQALEFLSDTMAPWLTRWEMSLNTQLLTIDEQKEYYFRFDTDDLIRPDMKSRYEAMASGIASRILNPNECRDWEDLDPYPGGDEYANPAITPGQGGQSGAK